MSGWARTPLPKNGRFALAKMLLALGLFGGVWILHSPAGAQPPGEPGDNRSPLPPAAQDRAAALKYQIPDRDRMMFQGYRDVRTGKQIGGITDFLPIAKETENSDEYRAWHEVVQHAVQFPASELVEHAGTELTWDDLTGSGRHHHRLGLIRFDGKVVRIRRLPASRSLQDAGTKEIYEAHLAAVDEPPTNLISIVFTELPSSLAAVKQSSAEEWVNPDVWAAAAGYFFKVKQDAPGGTPIPVLIGKSLIVLKEPPVGPDLKNPAALDRNLRVFKYIRDNAPISKGEENWEETTAWNRVLLHARRFSPEELEQLARTDLTFAELFKDVRRDYKLDLVKFEGRLISLKKLEPTQALRSAGVEAVYEGWLVPANEPNGNPICVLFTDRPEGVEPEGRVNRWVTFAGFSFKLLQYESGEKRKDDPTKYVWKKAPLLLGRAVIVRPDPDSATAVSWQGFAAIATAVVLTLLVFALGLSWWYRTGDRRVRNEMAAARAQNPFGGSV